MPTYAYRCPGCGAKSEVVKPMRLSDVEELCDTCEVVLIRDYHAEGLQCHADSYYRELHSDSLAICEGQRAEHMQKYPDVPLDRAGRPVLSSYKQHEAYMKARGVAKRPSRKEII